MFKTLLFLAIAGTFLLAQRPAQADFTSYKCLVSGPIKATVKHNACTGFVAGSTRVSFPYLGSGQLIASADNRTVAMVQSYLYGGLNRRREVVSFPSNEKNPTVLYLYRDGKLVSSHRIDDLVKRRALIWTSVSHVAWVRSATMSADGRLRLTTSDFRDHMFDARTGALVKSTDAPDWTSCDVIAGGKLDLASKKLIRPFDYKQARSTDSPLSFVWGDGLPRQLTDKAHTVGCFMRQGQSLIFTRQLPF